MFDTSVPLLFVFLAISTPTFQRKKTVCWILPICDQSFENKSGTKNHACMIITTTIWKKKYSSMEIRWFFIAWCSNPNPLQDVLYLAVFENIQLCIWFIIESETAFFLLKNTVFCWFPNRANTLLYNIELQQSKFPLHELILKWFYFHPLC